MAWLSQRPTIGRMVRRPNILWIVTTQWRAQACGYAGDPNAHTPHLDTLAQEAANFTQAVTPHPFGPFARAALLTGRRSPENGVREYFDPLPPNTPTLAHAAAEAGYATAFIGKWHLAPRDRTAALVGEAHAKTIVPPEHRGGFQFWEGFESGFVLSDPWLHGTRLPQPTRFPGYQSDVLCARAAERIAEFAREQEKRAAHRGIVAPWFAVVSLEPPHPPYAARATGIQPNAPASIILGTNVPRGGAVEAKARQELSGYYAQITATDRAIGRLLDSVRNEETIVVVTSVHGDMHGAHGLFRKGWPYEESVRVPLLVRVPMAYRGVESKWIGTRSELVTLTDVHRWTAEWLRGREVHVGERAFQEISMPSVVALPHQCDRAWRGGRTRDRKLVWAPAPDGDAMQPWLYFDLASDPGEERNLATDPARQSEIESLGRNFGLKQWPRRT